MYFFISKWTRTSEPVNKRDSILLFQSYQNISSSIRDVFNKE